MELALLVPLLIGRAYCQINLGSFSLRPSGPGGFDLGLGQSANVFGFGGDRGFRFAGGPQGVGMQSSGGALVGGERVGVDSGLGVQQSGVDLGSQMQFGNNPMPMHPAGQFGQFLDNVRNFFTNMLNPRPIFPSMPTPTLPTMTNRMGLPPPTLRPDLTDEEEPAVDGEAPPPRASRWESNEDSLPTTVSSFGSSKFDFKQAKDGDQDPVFKMVTEKPRQLPGLIDFRLR